MLDAGFDVAAAGADIAGSAANFLVLIVRAGDGQLVADALSRNPARVSADFIVHDFLLVLTDVQLLNARCISSKISVADYEK